MKKSDDLKPFHERLETMFNTMRLRIEVPNFTDNFYVATS